MYLALLHVLQDCTDKMDLNDLCHTFVSGRPKERRQRQIGGIVLTRAGKQKCMCGLFSVQCITINLYSEKSSALLNFRESFVG